jgi:hypothetical protein
MPSRGCLGDFGDLRDGELDPVVDASLPGPLVLRLGERQKPQVFASGGFMVFRRFFVLLLLWRGSSSIQAPVGAGALSYPVNDAKDLWWPSRASQTK